MMTIGLDLGTSALKLLLMEEDGRIVRSVTEEYPLSFPHPGWSEQDPADWVKAAKNGIKALTDGVDKSRIKAIAAAGQMHGLVILDEKDRVIRPAILWNDGRTAEECDFLNGEIGKERLSEYTANIAFPGFTAPKLLWLQKHEPENFRKIRKIMLPKDYVVYSLTGVHSSDPSDASGTLFYDVRNRCWSAEMAEILGIRLSWLPKMFESHEAVGTLLPGVAEELGLDQGVIVAAGAGDNAGAAVGTGAVGEGHCNLSLGTSGTVFITSKEFCLDPHNALHAFAHADGGYHLMGCMLSAASCNKWWVEDILKGTDYQKEQERISSLGHNSVYFLPYLMGERSPHNDPFARGAFLGMRMDTSRTEMTQAVLEGVAFGLRDSVEVARSMGISLTASTLCGGGAKSPLWRRILANVLNLRIDSVENEEGPAYGAAILAAVAAGAYKTPGEAAKKLVRMKDSLSPEAELVEAYEERYQVFKSLYPTLKPVFSRL